MAITTTNPNTVTGTIINSNSDIFAMVSFKQLLVKVFQTTVMAEKEIAAAPVKANGSFELTVAPAQNTTLVIRLYHLQDAKRLMLVAASGPHCPKEQIAVTLEYDAVKYSAPVFTVLKERVQAQVGKKKLNNLSEEQKKKLHCITGITDQAIAKMQQTERLVTEYQAALKKKCSTEYKAIKSRPALAVETEAIFFALLKNDNQPSLGKALTTTPKLLQQQIEKAVAANELPAQSASKQVVDAFITLRNSILLNAEKDDNYYGAKLIHLSSLSDAAKSDLLNTVIENGSLHNYLAAKNKATENRDKKAKKTAVANKAMAVAAELQLLVEIDASLEKFPPLLSVVVAELRKKGNGLDTKPLAAKTAKDWEALLKKVPGSSKTPDAYAGKKEAAKKYAAALEKKFAEKHPSTAIAAKIGSTKISGKAALKKLLVDNPDFDITRQASASFFTAKEKPGKANELTKEQLQNIQQLQRSIKLTNGLHNIAHTEALMQTGLHSASHIARMSEYAFKKEMDKQNVDAAAATTIYNRAVQTNNVVKLMAVQYLRYDSPSAMMPHLSGLNLFTNDAAEGMPDMESLFGSFDSCTCSECRSVYSPAAYLTDLLHWLSSLQCDNSNGSALDTLYGTAADRRRKDIADILLNCKNTNELLPYIDLVNEILSINLAKSPDYTVLQTTMKSAALIAEPEHRFPAEEQKLTTAFYPFNLPYDAAYDTATSYMEKLGVPPHSFVHAFTTKTDKYNSAAWAQSYLKFNDAEFNLVATNQTTSISNATDEKTFWGKFWGLNGKPVNVGELLKSTGLKLDELRRYFSSSFITASDVPIIDKPPKPDDCDIDKYTISVTFSTSIADRFMRFMRLHKKTNLTVWELDTAIRTMGGDMDEKFLIQLAAALAFTEKYRLPFAELMIWLNDKSYQPSFPGLQKTSDYYENKYRNQNYPDALKTFFDVAAGSGNAASTLIFQLTPVEKQKLCAVYNITPGDADTIIHYISFLPAATLAEANLAYFERYVSYCNTLGIPFTELPIVMELLTPLLQNSLANMQGIWQFEEIWSQFKNFGMTPSAIAELMKGTGRYELTATGQAIQPELADAAQSCWEKIQEALESARSSNPVAYLNETGIVADSPAAEYTELFSNTVIEQLGQSFGFDKELVKAVIKDVVDNFDTSWVDETIRFDGSIVEWASKEIVFTPLYRILLRISIVSKIFGLNEDGLAAGVNNEIKNTLPLPLPYFYWLQDNFTTDEIARSLINLKQITEQAAYLGLPQDVYIHFISAVYTYNSNKNTYYTTPPQIIIDTIYTAMDSRAVFKKLSAFQFAEMYKRAQPLSGEPQQLTEVIHTCIELFDIAAAAGVSIDEVFSWVYQSTRLADNITAFKRVLRSHFDKEEAWYAFITPLHNSLRMRLRDALVAYYIGVKGFKNSNALYAHFLLDTEMEPCMKTSRLVQAISSAQLLVHRGLMGLEKNVCINELDKKQWDWRKNYRVWEANRKVFLYPENWIEPSLRLNKTPFFKELEDVLQQDELNNDNCEKAFAGYLGNLNNIARLDIRATYVEELEGNTTPVLLDLENQQNTDVTTLGSEPNSIIHVIGRTWNPPFAYYHRKRKKNVWTAWEKIELDIEGDHLIPIMFNRRFYLFWPLFIEKEHRTIKIGDQNAPYYEIKLCYSKLEFGKWSAKKILDGSIYAGQYCGPGVYKNLERKLGKDIPVPTRTIVANPNENRALWNNSIIGRNIYGWPDPLAPNGPLKEIWISGDSLRDNLVLDNINFKDYSFVSLDKNDFYFWAEKQDKGDLIIHSRRRFDKSWNDKHFSYTEFAYEDSFLINNCNDRVEIIPPQVELKEMGIGKRFLSRPWLTIPYAQQIRKGLDGGDVMTQFPGQYHAELYIKFAESYERDTGNGEGLLTKLHSDYTLTYPHQYPHSLWNQPFFYSDKQNTFFIHLYGLEFSWIKNIAKWLGTFQDFQHPYACMMTAELNKAGLEGLLNAKNTELERQQALNTTPYFPTYYQSDYTFDSVPVKEFDFAISGSYSIYNWEIFFHSVSLIATQLRQHNKFAEAIRWLQFVFDPTNRDMDYGNLRYWKIKPFMKDVSQGSVQNLMRLLSASGLDDAQDQQRKEIAAQIADWEDNPFEPHRIAAMRNRAYMLWTVMEYIKTLTDWADSLFRQDTMESVNEAINLYILASEILGKRPRKIEKAAPPVISYNLINERLDEFSNAAVNIENQIVGSSSSNTVPVFFEYSLPELVFCIPENPAMVELWDRVEDRLFKIRHCMNIDGKKRELALFQPPIDPAFLIRAKAMGMDLADVLADLAAPLPHYRFSYLLQKANEFCNEVKGLGSQLLSALEKKDGEELAQIRQLHEQNMLKAARNIKKLQLEEAKNNYASLQHSKKLIEIRLNDYQGREFISSREEKTISLTKKAEGFMYAEQGANLSAAVLKMFPDTYAGYTPLLKLPGGDKLAGTASAIGSTFGIVSTVFRNMASMSSTYAGYDRRKEDWQLQIKTATEELNQMEKQLLGAEIRIAVAEKELDNHDLQAEQSKEVYDYMKGKFTNLQLYTWMCGELKTLHRRAYELAYDMAKQAQRAHDKELGIENTSIVSFGNWDSSKAGLLAGEKLSLQLKQLDASYIKNNTREYEIVKHVSLNLLDPLAIIELKNTGKCNFEIPEVLYDLDYPGHYFRRIKSVSLSIPFIAGPYTSISASLTLTRHKTRKQDVVNAPEYTVGYPETIVTSSAQNDSGVFELNFRDERYVPFEGKGAISTWELELPSALKQFDHTTISDVVMHIKYTAREGGSVFKKAAADSLLTKINAIEQSLHETGLHTAINIKHDMPNEWHLLKNSGKTKIKIDKSRLFYFAQNLSIADAAVIFISNEPVNVNGSVLTGNESIYKSNKYTVTLNDEFELTVSILETTELIMLVNFKVV